jgi:hypothetical protein
LLTKTLKISKIYNTYVCLWVYNRNYRNFIASSQQSFKSINSNSEDQFSDVSQDTSEDEDPDVDEDDEDIEDSNSEDDSVDDDDSVNDDDSGDDEDDDEVDNYDIDARNDTDTTFIHAGKF